MWFPRSAWALAPVALIASVAAAQGGPAKVNGVVSDSSGAPLAGAEISAIGVELRARSDTRGAFQLTGVPLGPLELEARRLGFRPETLTIAVATIEGASAAFRLRPIAEALPTVRVNARRKYTGRLAGYHERLAANTGGHFITREKIDQLRPRQVTDLLRTVPGVDVIRGTRVRLRGRGCAPLIWLDGTQMPAGEVDINSFPPMSIEGIEVYASATGAPFRYQGTRDQGRCGTILIWSRGADTELRRAEVPGIAEQLERLAAAEAVKTADEVDSVARPKTPDAIVVTYPPELFANGTSGLVIAEFIVDSLGRTEPTSFGVLSSSHPLFAVAVHEAVDRALFEPARLGGRAVRQLVQMRFRFEPPGRR